MELALLSIFVDVVKKGSYAEAARARGLTASAVSRSVSGLENALGIRLFHRSTRKMSLTEAGKDYYRRVDYILSELKEANAIASDHEKAMIGRIRVSAPVTFGQVCIVPLLSQITRQYPELHFDFLVTDEVVDLLDQRLDVAIRLGRGRMNDTGFVARKLCPMSYTICASVGYLARNGRPAAPAELAKHSCVTLALSGYSTSWLFRDASGHEQRIAIRPRHRVTNAAWVREFAIGGMGIALLPDWVVADSVARGDLVPLLADHEVTPHDFDAAAWVIYPSRKHVPHRVRVFIDFLLEAFRAIPAWAHLAQGDDDEKKCISNPAHNALSMD